MVPVVVLLQSMEPTPLVLAGVYEVECVVRNIIYHVAHQEERPDRCVDDRILEHQDLLHKTLDGQVVYHEEEGHRQNESISG